MINPPLWFFKPIDVENLRQLQQELLPVILKKVPNILTIPNDFIRIWPEEIIPYAPNYVDFIKKNGIYSRWRECAIIITNKGIEFPIHVDSHDWKDLCYGLNIPIINCDKTHVVWYDAEIESEIDPADQNYRDTARRQKENTNAKEIARMEISQPAWVNTSIPHRPVSTHRSPQILLSARFNPELHELLY